MRRNRWGLVAALMTPACVALVWTAAAGCSSDTFRASAAQDAAPSDAGSDTPQVTPGDAAPAQRAGSVTATILQNKFVGQALFEQDPTRCVAGPITGTTCIETLCKPMTASPDWPNAGDITFSKGSTTFATLSVDASSPTGYPATGVNGPPWDLGSRGLIIAAKGAADAAVPAFHVAIDAPMQPVVTSSPFSDVVDGGPGGFASVTLSRSKNLTIQWTHGAADENGVSLFVTFNPSATPNRNVLYRLDQTSGTIPSTVLTALGGDGTYGIVARSEVDTTAGGWNVQVLAGWYAGNVYTVTMSGNYTLGP